MRSVEASGKATVVVHTQTRISFSLASAVKKHVLSPNAPAHGGGCVAGLVRRRVTLGSFQGFSGRRSVSSAPVRSGKFAVLEEDDVAFFRWLIISRECHIFALLRCNVLVLHHQCA